MRLLASAAVLLACSALVAAEPLTMFHARNRFHNTMKKAKKAKHLASGGSMHALPPAQFFNQTLDHFNPLNLGWWGQRFWVNASMWTGDGPVFLYIEGEGAGNALDVVQGQHVELAGTYGALVIALEHRFFGASIPTPDLSLNSLAVLNSQQAIGDVSRFIQEYMVPTFNLQLTKNKIVTFGGSYPGNLSNLLRLRLPHLVHSAIATSGPIYALADYQGYHNVVADVLSDPTLGGSTACLNNVQSAFATLDAAMTGTVAQQTAMSNLMSSCAPAVTPNDAMWLASNVGGQIDGLVQYNLEGGVNPISVGGMCGIMTNASYSSPIQALAAVVKATLAPGQTCMDNSYTDFIAQLSNTTADFSATGVGMRQWTYMTCVQWGFFQTCEAGTQCPLSKLMTLQSNVQICQDAFAGMMDLNYINDRMDFTNDYFGAFNQGGSRILYVSCLSDPWHADQILPGTLQNSANEAISVVGAAHCRPMFPSLPSDPQPVQAARAQTASILGSWLQQPYFP